MKDIKDQIERAMDAKLKAYGRTDKAEDRKMIADHEGRMHGGPKMRAAGGAVEGMPARPRMDRKGGKSKKSGSKTNVNVIVAPKPDTPPAMPGPVAGPPAGASPVPPPRPPMPPVVPPPGAGGPPPPGMAGGAVPPPMMRKAGGRVSREDGGRLSADSEREAAAQRATANSEAKKAVGSSAVAAATALANRLGGRGRLIGHGLTAANAAFGADSLLKSRAAAAEADRIEKGLAKPGEEDRARGGRVDMKAGAGSGEGRLEKIKAQENG